jgi:hypothetical protein
LKEQMRPELETILKQLLTTGADEISLDVIGETIGATRISQDEIERLLERLEQAGKQIGGPSPKVRQHLRPVIEQARRLRQERQATPNVGAIAEATGLSVAEVRAALLYAQVLGR